MGDFSSARVQRGEPPPRRPRLPGGLSGFQLASLLVVVFAVVVLLLSGDNESQQSPSPASGVAYTNGGYFGCTSKEALNDMIAFVIAKDTTSMQGYISSGKCSMLNSGVKVTVTGASIGDREFVYEGVKLYALAEALRN